MDTKIIISISLFFFGVTILLYNFFAKKATQKKFVELKNHAKQSNTEFDKLCTPYHYFTDLETKNFLKQNEVLRSQLARILQSRWLTVADKNSSIIDKFVNNYDKIYYLQRKNNQIIKDAQFIDENINSASFSVTYLLGCFEYLSNHLIRNHKQAYDSLYKRLERFIQEGNTIYCKDPELCADVFNSYQKLNNELTVKKLNQGIVNWHKEFKQDFFTTCLDYPLDEQQQEAILHEEDNTLVIASAGSGKTSTIVGKAKYLVEVQKVDPKKILIISYTNKACDELNERLHIEGLTCCTFHKLALDAIGEISGERPSVADDNYIKIIYDEMIRKNENFQEAINRYLWEFQSGMKLEHDYDDSREYYKNRGNHGCKPHFRDMNDRMIFTKSEEERRICDWLSLHGINYVYEEPYEHKTVTQEHKQYAPDFSIHYLNRRNQPCRLYLEHFGIDKQGNVPKWFGCNYHSDDQSEQEKTKRWKAANTEYINGIEWKKELHKANFTNLIYTTSAMFHDGSIWKELEKQLMDYDVPMKHIPTSELYKMLISKDAYAESSIIKLISQFITLAKNHITKLDSLVTKAKENEDFRSQFIIKEIIIPLYKHYQKNLEENNLVDYTDMIIHATELCKGVSWKSYEYILVDEFQDISMDRGLFLSALRKDTPSCFTKLFCVGDDWQSIYRFAGSDINLFYNFEKFFGYSKICKIEKTYRFHQPLIKFSSNFIQQNPDQIHKDIVDIAENESIKTAIYICKYSSTRSESEVIESLVRKIPENESIAIIARYGYNRKDLNVSYNRNDPNSIYLGNRKVRFMTIHSAKGLEADHVFVMNCNRGKNGIPSLVEDDPILSYVLSQDDQYEYAEERRVFYVAMTRAKKKLYLIFKEDNPSPFLQELVPDVFHKEQYGVICPKCGIGTLSIVKQGHSDYYGDWVTVRCNNTRGGCDYFGIMGLDEFRHLEGKISQD